MNFTKNEPEILVFNKKYRKSYRQGKLSKKVLGPHFRWPKAKLGRK